VEKVQLFIDAKELSTWTSIKLSLALDSFAVVTFTAPFDPSRKEIRDTFRPFTYKPMRVAVGGRTLFTGTMVDVLPSVDPQARTVDVTGYSLPGVLQDCGAPGTKLPHEFRKLTLHAIAQKLCEPFGVRLAKRAEPGKAFDKAKLEQGAEIFGFLAELARQRGQVLSSTPEGELVFWTSIASGNPVASFAEGRAPLSKVTPRFSPQDCFSEITGFGCTKRGRRGGKHTERNPWLRNVLRPMSCKFDDTETAGTPEATRAKMGRMFGNMATWTVDDLPGWRDPEGFFWEPNRTVKLLAPGAMVYRESELLIRTVELEQDANKEWATLGLVLPGAFNGQSPPFLPWNE